MKSLTRRDLILKVFSKDALKELAGACREFTEAKDKAGRISCDEAGLLLGAGSKRKKNIMNFGKEG